MSKSPGASRVTAMNLRIPPCAGIIRSQRLYHSARSGTRGGNARREGHKTQTIVGECLAGISAVSAALAAGRREIHKLWVLGDDEGTKELRYGKCYGAAIGHCHACAS
jgi:hypothetical protein